MSLVPYLVVYCIDCLARLVIDKNKLVDLAKNRFIAGVFDILLGVTGPFYGDTSTSRRDALSHFS